MSTGYLACSFDMLNVRDLAFIAEARARCTRLIVGVFTDEFVQRTAGRPALVPLHERLMLLRHVRGVDQVIVHASERDWSHAPAVTVFAAVGEAGQPEGESVTVLASSRETSSPTLRAALRPTAQAVA